MCVATVALLDVVFGFDEHPQPVHLLPLQLVQLTPKVVVDKVQLFGEFPLLQPQKQHVQYNLFMSTESLFCNRLFAEYTAVP